MADSTADKQELFRPGKAEWLRKEGGQSLDGDQKALLLALMQLEAASGRELTPEETQTIESLGEQLPDNTTEQLRQAMQRLVQSPTDPDRKISWPKLKDD